MAGTKENRGKYYEFWLNSIAGEKRLTYNPINWDKINFVLKRKDDGIFVSFSADLEFVKDGYDYIVNILDNYGILTEIILTIKYLGNVINVSKLDLTSTVQSPDSRNSIKVPLLSDNFNERINARANIEIPYNRLISLDDESIEAHTPEYYPATIYGMPFVEKNIECSLFQPTRVQFNGQGDPWAAVFQFVAPDGYEALGLRSVMLSYDNSRLWNLSEGYPAFNVNSFIPTHCFYYAKSETVVNIDINLKYKIGSNIGDPVYIVCLMQVNFDDAGLPILGEEVAVYFQRGQTNNSETIHEFITNQTVTLQQHQGLVMWGAAVSKNILGYEVKSWIDILENNIIIDYNIRYDNSSVNIVKLWDLHNRLVAAITNDNTAFRSNVLSDTGKWGHIGFTNGLSIRGFSFEDSAISINLNDLKSDTQKLLNVAYGTIFEDGKYKLICEERKDFYRNDIIKVLNNINANSFTREFNKDYWYSAIKVGCEKSAYEKVSGLEEYNNKNTFSTILSTLNNELDLLTKTRTDGYGVTFAKELPFIGNETTDSEYDNDNWFIELVKDGETYKQRTNEDFENITGLDGITTPMNLNFTPARTVYRWGWWFGACLQKYLTKPIKFNTSEAKSDLATKRYDESVIVSENADIDPTDLENPIFTGYVYKFSAPISLSVLSELMSDPYGLIQFINPLTNKPATGWIIEVSNNPVNDAGESNWTILEAKEFTEIIKILGLETTGDALLTEDDKYFIEI